LIPFFRVFGPFGPKSGGEIARIRSILSPDTAQVFILEGCPFNPAQEDAAMATADVRKTTPGTTKAMAKGAKRFHGRLKVDARFCPTDVDDLFSTVDWEVRSAQIKGENGELIFEQTNCEVPSFW